MERTPISPPVVEAGAEAPVVEGGQPSAVNDGPESKKFKRRRESSSSNSDSSSSSEDVAFWESSVDFKDLKEPVVLAEQGEVVDLLPEGQSLEHSDKPDLKEPMVLAEQGEVVDLLPEDQILKHSYKPDLFGFQKKEMLRTDEKRPSKWYDLPPFCLFEPRLGSYVLERKKKLIQERELSSECNSAKCVMDHGWSSPIQQYLRISVEAYKGYDNKQDPRVLKNVLEKILRATRIFYLDRTELYFVGEDDYGPFSPFNELESLYSIFKSVKSLIDGIDACFKEFLRMLHAKVHEEICSYAQEYSEKFSDKGIYAETEGYNDLFKWWREDMKMEINLMIADVGGEKRFVASKNIDVGDTVLSVPVDKVIDGKVLLGHEMHDNLVRSGFSTRELLLLGCIKEGFTDNSKFRVYVKSMPNLNTGLSFGDAAYSAIKETKLGSRIGRTEKVLAHQYNKELCPKLAPFSDLFPTDKYTWDKYLQACEFLYCHGISLCSSDGEQRTFLNPLIDGSRKTCLIPLTAFFDRSLCPHVLRCDKVDNGALKFIAVRPCKKGELCYLGCENLSGVDLITYYGVLPKGDNHHDVLITGLNEDDDPDYPLVHCKWPCTQHMLRGTWLSSNPLPELLKDYLCAHSALDKKDKSKENMREMLWPISGDLKDRMRNLGEDKDDPQYLGHWDLKLAVKYKEKMRKIVKSVQSLVYDSSSDEEVDDEVQSSDESVESLLCDSTDKELQSLDEVYPLRDIETTT